MVPAVFCGDEAPRERHRGAMREGAWPAACDGSCTPTQAEKRRAGGTDLEPARRAPDAEEPAAVVAVRIIVSVVFVGAPRPGAALAPQPLEAAGGRGLGRCASISRCRGGRCCRQGLLRLRLQGLLSLPRGRGGGHAANWPRTTSLRQAGLPRQVRWRAAELGRGGPQTAHACDRRVRALVNEKACALWS